jgi:hypothetical protein
MVVTGFGPIVMIEIDYHSGFPVSAPSSFLFPPPFYLWCLYIFVGSCISVLHEMERSKKPSWKKMHVLHATNF